MHTSGKRLVSSLQTAVLQVSRNRRPHFQRGLKTRTDTLQRALFTWQGPRRKHSAPLVARAMHWDPQTPRGRIKSDSLRMPRACEEAKQTLLVRLGNHITPGGQLAVPYRVRHTSPYDPVSPHWGLTQQQLSTRPHKCGRRTFTVALLTAASTWGWPESTRRRIVAHSHAGILLSHLRHTITDRMG